MLEPLYTIGDFVKIKDLETLKRELGNPIHALCGWVNDMDRYAGGVYEVVELFKFGSGDSAHYSYQFRETAMWWFSEDVLEFLPDTVITPESLLISYEEVMGVS